MNAVRFRIQALVYDIIMIMIIMIIIIIIIIIITIISKAQLLKFNTLSALQRT